MDLQARIQRAKDAIAKYPQWVRRSMVFQGGGVRRGDNGPAPELADFPSKPVRRACKGPCFCTGACRGYESPGTVYRLEGEAD